MLPAQLQIRAERDDDEGVLVLPEHGADLFEGADDGELGVFGANGAAQRVDVGKELLGHAIADQADAARVAVFEVGEVAAGIDRAGIDDGHRGRVAEEGGVFELAVAEAQRGAARKRGAHHPAMRALEGKSGDVLRIEKAIALRLGDRAEVDHGERQAADAEDVGAEVGDLLLDVDVGALHQGHHGDQGGDTHGQAENGQRSAELMGADRIGGEGEIVSQAEHALGEISVA